MISNLERYRGDLSALIKQGGILLNALQHECLPEQYEAALRKKVGKKTQDHLQNLPSFTARYQEWYSEAKALIRQLLPDRLADFSRYYEKPRSRKDISFENYVIEDCLQGLQITRSFDQTKVVGRDAAIPLFAQQLAIVQSVEQRFESSLFDIRQIVQTDLFDSELDASRELAKNKFVRAAGALAGVVLERHLAQVAANHQISLSKKNPGISDWNEALKAAGVCDIPQWRFIQHLGDLRNRCDHSKQAEPTADQVNDLVNGAAKITKTLF